MSLDDNLVEIRLIKIPDLLGLIRILRSSTSYSIAEIKQAASQQGTLALGRLHNLDHHEVLARIQATLDALESKGVEFELVYAGHSETREGFGNLMASWDEILEDMQVYTDLELGGPNIETLETMKAKWPADIYLATLRQIHKGEGYDIDEDTLKWVENELGRFGEP
ncbi:hypothetical protein [Bremerella sp.]|uniref:hypothetical protein n=1 Tax=Bremerella sp. TaxID=2795602 RepID=UPI00391DC1E3